MKISQNSQESIHGGACRPKRGRACLAKKLQANKFKIVLFENTIWTLYNDKDDATADILLNKIARSRWQLYSFRVALSSTNTFSVLIN